MNSSLEKLVRNLVDDDFKYLTEEFGSKNLELLKQKGADPYENMNSFERFSEEKLPDKKCFFSSTKKKGKIGDNGKKLDGHINNEDYLTWLSQSLFEKSVLLLADVFEKFIDMCLKCYGLDPCH